MTDANGRVRDIKIENLQKDISEMQKNCDDAKKDIAVLAKELIEVKIQLATLSERMKLFQIAQGIFTIIATGIVAYIAYMISM